MLVEPPRAESPRGKYRRAASGNTKAKRNFLRRRRQLRFPLCTCRGRWRAGGLGPARAGLRGGDPGAAALLRLLLARAQPPGTFRRPAGFGSARLSERSARSSARRDGSRTHLLRGRSRPLTRPLTGRFPKTAIGVTSRGRAPSRAQHSARLSPFPPRGGSRLFPRHGEGARMRAVVQVPVQAPGCPARAPAHASATSSARASAGTWRKWLSP